MKVREVTFPKEKKEEKVVQKRKQQKENSHYEEVIISTRERAACTLIIIMNVVPAATTMASPTPGKSRYLSGALSRLLSPFMITGGCRCRSAFGQLRMGSIDHASRTRKPG